MPISSSASPGALSRSPAFRSRKRAAFEARSWTASCRSTFLDCPADSAVWLGEKVAPLRVAAEQGSDVAALRHDLEAFGPGILDQRFHQLLRDSAAAHFRRHERVIDDSQRAERLPGKFGWPINTRKFGAVGAVAGLVASGDRDGF